MKNPFASLPSFIDSTLLLAWGILLITMGAEGPLAELLHPFFRPVCVFSGFILSATALILPFYPKENTSPLRSVKMMQRMIFALPLILAFTIRPEGLSREALLNRGLGSLPLLHENFSQDSAAMFRDEHGIWHISPVDAWFISRSPSERKEFTDAKIAMIGQILFREKNYTDNTPLIFRIWVTCCVADATPVALPLHDFNMNSDHDIPDLAWINVQGILRFSESPQHLPNLKVTSWEPIPRPRNIYLFR